MAERSEEKLIEKIEGKVHGSDSSSDSVHNKPKPSESSLKAKIYGLFGRERPVHKVLGGGKQADLFLWRDKKASAAVLGGATVIWALFELMEYHLLTLLCHCLILSLSILFLWSNATTFIKKSPPQIPQLSIPEDLVVNIARSLRFEINRSLAILREIASGHDLKKFLAVIAGFWLLSIIGSCTSFLTILYIALPSVECPGCTLAVGDSPVNLAGGDGFPGNVVGFSPTVSLLPGIGDAVNSSVLLEPAPALLSVVDGGLVNVDVLEDCVSVQDVVAPVESIEMGG